MILNGAIANCSINDPNFHSVIVACLIILSSRWIFGLSPYRERIVDQSPTPSKHAKWSAVQYLTDNYEPMLRKDDCAAGDLPREVPSAAVIMSVCGTSYGVKACIWPSNRRMVSQRQHDFSLPSAFWNRSVAVSVNGC
jgi:hypothetical protein